MGQCVMVRSCEACGNPPGPAARFCDACGQLLSEGERKIATVMFVDIVASMDLERELEEERFRALLERFFEVAVESVQRYGGVLDKFTGDGIVALFGAPVAQEDHARRACLSALALHAALEPLRAELAPDAAQLAIRVGLSSGEVIVGEIGDEGLLVQTAIGQAVAQAQQMEPLAPPGSTAVSASTAALLDGGFALRELRAETALEQRALELLAPGRPR